MLLLGSGVHKALMASVKKILKLVTADTSRIHANTVGQYDRSILKIKLSIVFLCCGDCFIMELHNTFAKLAKKDYPNMVVFYL